MSDSVSLVQDSFYDEKGITAISNNNAVVSRDQGGNVLIQPTSSLLVIEAITTNILAESVLPLLNTQFNYFRFPVTTTTIDTDVDLDLDLDLDLDNITTELKIPVETDSQGQPINVTKINTSFQSYWYYGLDARQISKGYKQLQFTGGAQPVVNGYTLTKDIIKTLKDKNQTLRFVINTQFVPNEGVTGPVGIWLKLNRKNPKIYREFEEIGIYTEAKTSGDAGSGTNPNGLTSTDYPILLLEYVVDYTDIQIDDTYYVEAMASRNSWILPENSYWTVEPIDIPSEPGIFGWSPTNTQGTAGVYNLNFDTILLSSSSFNEAPNNSNNGIIAKRTQGTNQQLTVV